MRLLDRVFNEVHMLMGVVFMVVGRVRGIFLAPFSFYLLDIFVLVA